MPADHDASGPAGRSEDPSSGARASSDPDPREALREAEAARRAAEDADRAKTEFLAVVSHEIRTPLNGILGYLDLLEAGIGGSISPQQTEYVDRARSSGRHLLSVVEEILDLALVESGQLEMERSHGRLSEVIDSAVTLVAPQASEGGIRLRNTTAGGDGPRYFGNEDRVRRILVNLLSNAVKFTDSGGRITVSAGTAPGPPRGARAPRGPAAVVRVEDTGAGIPPERLSVIFEPTLGTAEPTGRSREGRGAGIGLAISRRLARTMGGDITATSTPGTGSTFVLWLPAGEEEGEAVGEGDQATAPRVVSDVILKELERTLRIFVARLRTDDEIPTAHVQDESVLENHIATFLADLAYSLVALDDSSELEGEHLRDGSEIQRMVAYRHGQHRARLGWSEKELHREFAVLREELEAAIERRAAHAAAEVGAAAREALDRLLERAERDSVEALLEVGTGDQASGDRE